MIIDAHIHLGGPDMLNRKTLATEQLISEMDAHGIDKAVVFPFNQPENAFAPANDHIIRSVDDHPERLIGFGRLNPQDGEKALQELDRIHSMGLKGIKLHPTAQDFSMDHEYLQRIAQTAAQYGLVLLFDTGKPQSRPEDVQQFAKQHPDTTIIMAHMRGDFIPALISCPNLYIQTTEMPRPEVIEKAVRELGADRIMMGSDHPYLGIAAEVEKIRHLHITDKDRKSLMERTAAQVLRL